MVILKKIFNDFQEKVKLIKNNIKILKYHLKEPDPGTLWYCLRDSRFLLKLRLFSYLIGVIFILFLFSIFRFIYEHESLVVFIYIVWFCSSIFYIEFIRV